MYMKDQALVFYDQLALDESAGGTYKDLAFHAGAFSMYGQSKAMGLVLTMHEDAVDAGAGTDENTYNFKLIMADDEAGTNATTIIDETIDPALMEAGKTFVFPIPKRDTFKRWYKVTTTIAGATPDGSASASLDPVDVTAHYKAYPSVTG